MRTTHRCPKCRGAKLYVCENRQPAHDSGNGLHSLTITSVPITRKALGLPHKWHDGPRTDVGAFQTWICAQCGYTEWYAQDPERILEKLAAVPDSGVSVVVDPEEGAPFR